MAPRDVQVIIELARDFPDANCSEIAEAVNYANAAVAALPSVEALRRVAREQLEVLLDREA